MIWHSSTWDDKICFQSFVAVKRQIFLLKGDICFFFFRGSLLLSYAASLINFAAPGYSVNTGMSEHVPRGISDGWKERS